MQKVCYLPLTTLLLKPLHRVLHYQLLLERKLKFHTKGQLFREGHEDKSVYEKVKVRNNLLRKKYI